MAMGDKMEEDETPRGGYKEALLSAAGKRERSKAHTGLTPPAKATLGRKEDSTHRQEKDQPEMQLEDLSMEEEILPQWSADEDDEALLKEAFECGTTQHEEPKESASGSGAKRSLELTHTDPSDLPKEKQRGVGTRRGSTRCSSYRGTQALYSANICHYTRRRRLWRGLYSPSGASLTSK